MLCKRGLVMALRCFSFPEASANILVHKSSQREICPGNTFRTNTNASDNSVVQVHGHQNQIVPASLPPRTDDIVSLQRFIQDSQKLVVLTGAGISTESGIPDYRSPNGAYSTGFKPISHQEFVRSERSRRRYWARSYAGWQRFISAQPGPTHRTIAHLESRGYIQGIITQNVDRLHHWTTHEVICLDCGDLTSRHMFQEKVKALNLEWTVAVEALQEGKPASIGMQQRPDGDIEIEESFWESRFLIPECHCCGGTLKPNVVLFGNNIPKSRAEQALEMVTKSDAFLVMGSSLMVLSAFRLAKAAYDKGIPLAIVNIGSTRADHMASLKIECRTGEILSRVLDGGSFEVPIVR